MRIDGSAWSFGIYRGSGCDSTVAGNYAPPIIRSCWIRGTPCGNHIFTVLVAGIWIYRIRINSVAIGDGKSSDNGTVIVGAHVDGDGNQFVVHVNNRRAVCGNRGGRSLVIVGFISESAGTWLSGSRCGHRSNGSRGSGTADKFIL